MDTVEKESTEVGSHEIETEVDSSSIIFFFFYFPSRLDDCGLILRNVLDISLPSMYSTGVVLPAVFSTAVERRREPYSNVIIPEVLQHRQ